MARTLLNKVPNDEVLSNHLTNMFHTYDDMTPDKPSSYFLWSNNDFKSKEFLSNVCHAGLPGLDRNIWDNLITAVPKSDEISLAYQRMLIQGPFKGLSDLITLESKGNNYYIRCTNLDKWPSNVLYNYCIATRLPIEFNNLLPRWNELVKVGFNSTLALLLSQSTNGTPFSKNYGRKFPNSNHMWFDPSSDWLAIVNGEMLDPAPESFKKQPAHCFPCNVIWGSRQNYFKYITMSDEEISEQLGLPIVISKPPPKRPTFKPNKIPPIDWVAIQAAQHPQLAQFEDVAPPQAPPEGWGQHFLGQEVNALQIANNQLHMAIEAAPAVGQLLPQPIVDWEHQNFDDDDDDLNDIIPEDDDPWPDDMDDQEHEFNNDEIL